MMTTLLALWLALAAPGAAPSAAPSRRPAAPPAADPPAAPQPTAGEWAAEFVEYRALPELGQITISDGVVRGRKPVEYLRSHATKLAARGIFGCTDRDRRRSFRRVDELAGRKFETLIVIAPPADEDGGWTRRVTVLVDGRRKLDCSVGDSPDGEVFVYGVTIFPDDGTIEVAAVDANGEELYPPRELELIDDPGVITDDTLMPDEGVNDPEPKRLERA
jgi:hypothetical protein